MNNLVNRLNEYLKIFKADGISFEYDCLHRRMEIRLPVKSPQKSVEMHIYGLFNNNDEFFERITPIYNEILTRREIDSIYISKCNSSYYTFAYHKVNTGALSFLKTLSSCSSLKELEMKLQIMGYGIWDMGYENRR